jgi:hypothetical protein
MTSPSEEFVIRRRRLDLGTAQTLDAEGLVFTHLRVSDASDSDAAVNIVFANLDNPGIELKRGRRLKNFAIRSGKVWFTNSAQAGKWIEIEYWGGPQIGPPEIVEEGLLVDVSQLGDLTVNAASLGSIKRVRVDRQSFMGGVRRPAGAAQYSKIQILNPAASGVDVILTSAKLLLDTNINDVQIHRDAGALATLGWIGSKYIGGAAPLAQLRSELGAATGTKIITIAVADVPYGAAANPVADWFQVINGDPIVIPEGKDIYFRPEIQNSKIAGNFEWLEVPKV